MTESKPTKVESSSTTFNGNPQNKGYKNCQPFIPKLQNSYGILMRSRTTYLMYLMDGILNNSARP
jgi:hypothetical protein